VTSTDLKLRDHARKVMGMLKKAYPKFGTALAFGDPLELLVATILSAQCTDKRVNIVTASLFKKYRSVKDYAAADVKAFEQEIRSTGFYRNKARNIIAAAKIIKKDFGGHVPESMDKLIL
jgi:endonuclease III